MKQHPLSSAFPAIPESDRAALRADLEANGQQILIVLYEGMVLDGWHRYCVLIELGIEPKTKILPEGKDPRAFVRSVNMHRRHLNASQRAMAEVAISEWCPAHRPTENKGAPGAPLSKTRSQMADAAKVSLRTINQAKVVTTEAPAATVKAVKDGEKSVKAAAAEVAEAKKPKPTKEKHEVVRDVTGYAIPEKILPLWNRRQEVKDIQNEIASVIRDVKAIREKPDPLWQTVNMQAIEISLSNCKRDLDGATPYAVCTVCQGRSMDSCTACKGRGFISRHHYETCVPIELKVIRDKSCVK
jgi:hypothetical protein